jgi:hypothetical protein
MENGPFIDDFPRRYPKCFPPEVTTFQRFHRSGTPVKSPLKISITSAKEAPLAPPKGKVTPWNASRAAGEWLRIQQF